MALLSKEKQFYLLDINITKEGGLREGKIYHPLKNFFQCKWFFQ